MMLNNEIVSLLEKLSNRLALVESALNLKTPDVKASSNKTDEPKTLFSDKDQFEKDKEWLVTCLITDKDVRNAVDFSTADLDVIVKTVLNKLKELYRGTKFCEATSRGGCNTCQLSYEHQIKVLRKGLEQIAGYTSRRSTVVHKLPDSLDAVNSIAIGTLEVGIMEGLENENKKED